jgi:hypothetical protein
LKANRPHNLGPNFLRFNLKSAKWDTSQCPCSSIPPFPSTNNTPSSWTVKFATELRTVQCIVKVVVSYFVDPVALNTLKRVNSVLHLTAHQKSLSLLIQYQFCKRSLMRWRLIAKTAVRYTPTTTAKATGSTARPRQHLVFTNAWMDRYTRVKRNIWSMRWLIVRSFPSSVKHAQFKQQEVWQKNTIVQCSWPRWRSWRIGSLLTKLI